MHAFWIRSGIIQGCALSGSLFAAALSPALRDLCRSFEVPRRGIKRACADNLGGAIDDLRLLLPLHRAMKIVEVTVTDG
eukprot:3039925-Pyramimonas_sp.AAC.1